MNDIDVLEKFSRNFVLPEFRERFLHEAAKKPRKLHERVCHHMSELIPSKYRGQTVIFSPTSHCIMFAGGPAEQLSWQQASRRVGSGGVLIIETSGQRFYAESEGQPKVEVWAGEC